MKQISDKFGSKSFLAGGLACLLSLSVGLAQRQSAVAQEAQDGSLNDMWQDHAQDLKPSDPAAAATQKPAEATDSKKSKKEKKKKKKEKSNWDADLTKPPPESSKAPGWNDNGQAGASGSEVSKPAADSGSLVDSALSGASSTLSKPSSTLESTSSTTTTTPAKSSLYSPTIKGLDTTSGSSTPSTSTAPVTGSSASSSSSSATSSTPSASSSSESSAEESSTSSAAGETPPTPITRTTPASSALSSDSSAQSNSSSDTSIASSGNNMPLCKLSSLASSDFVKSGGWPGVGPFTKDGGKDTDLVDESKNRLRLKLSGEDVTHAELLVVNQSTKPSQLLALQMTTDFLLEAVGAQSGKIAELNSSLEQNHSKLIATAPDAPPGELVSMKAGTYLVNIQRKTPSDQTVPGNTSYFISVDNQKPQAVIASSDISSTTKPPDQSYNSNFTVKTLTSSSSGTHTTTPAKTTPPAVKPADDQLKTQFTNLIQGWQQVKRTAVKSRQTANLTRILGGKALTIQNNAINWLLNNRVYYEMTPLEFKLQNYKPLVPQVKYEVDCFIKERQQLMSADTMKPVKELVEKSSNVVYTVEKIRGAWLITDTRVLQ